MNKRLRKKKHLKEFQELGFEFSCRSLYDEKESNIFFDALYDLIDSRGLEMGGGGHLVTPECEEWYFGGFITRYRGSVTEEDRLAVLDFLQKQAKLHDVKIEALRDAWYD